MEAVQKTTSITIDNNTLDVSTLSAQVQQMVSYFDDWRQKEQEAVSGLLMIRGGLRNIQNELLTAIQQELAKKESVDNDGPIEVVSEDQHIIEPSTPVDAELVGA